MAQAQKIMIYSCFLSSILTLTIFSCVMAQEVILCSAEKTDAQLQNHSRGGRTRREQYRKENPRTPKNSKTIQTMNLEELNERKNYLIENNDKALAIKYVEKMIPLADDLDQKGLLMLELANLHFDCGNLKVAEPLYKEFKSMYPNHEKTVDSYYKQILTSFLRTLDSDRDQSKTKETLELTEDFLKNKTFTSYVQDVENIQKQCCKKVLEHEAGIFNYYLKKGSFRAAEQRLDKIEKNQYALQLSETPALLQELQVALNERKAEIGIQGSLLIDYKSLIKEKEPIAIANADTPAAVTDAS